MRTLEAFFKHAFYFSMIHSGSTIRKYSKDREIALKMNRKPCPGGFTNHPATKYLGVSKFYELTESFYTN